MHLATLITLFLAYSCAVYAHKPHKSFGRMYTWQDDEIFHIPSHRPASPSEIIDFYPSERTWFSRLIQQTQPFLQEDTGDTSTDFATRRWHAPEYFKSLDAFDHAVAEVTRHLSNYDDQYYDMVNMNIEKAMGNAWAAAEIIKCGFDVADYNIRRMRKILKNRWVQFVCGEHPSACDTVGYAVVNMSLDNELKHQADVLLKLGHAASTFLESYADVIANMTAQNANTWLVQGKENLRALIHTASTAARAVGLEKSDCLALNKNV